jgi:hypothetical protein
MTISIEQLLEQSQMKLLQASVDQVNKDIEITALKETVRLQEAQITALQCRLQRAAIPFHSRAGTVPALLRRQAE